MAHLNIAGPRPGDIAGQPAYTVRVSPKHDGGLLGAVALAWDSAHGVPLSIGVYARNDATPVLSLKATDVSFGPVSSSVFEIKPPSGAKVVTVSTPSGASASDSAAKHGKGQQRHAEVTGVAAVARHLSFGLVAPAKLVGLPRQSVSLLDSSGNPGALITYGQNLGGVVVIEQRQQMSSAPSANTSGGDQQGLTLPSVSIRRRQRPGARHGAWDGGALLARGRHVHGPRLGAGGRGRRCRASPGRARTMSDDHEDGPAVGPEPTADALPGPTAVRSGPTAVRSGPAGPPPVEVRGLVKRYGRADCRRRRGPDRPRRRRVRLPGPQRRRQDDLAADDARADSPDRRHGAAVRPRSDGERARARWGRRVRRGADVLSLPDRSAQPRAAGCVRRRPRGHADRGRVGDGRARRPRPRPRRRLLARDAPAAWDRGGTAARPQAAVARRAGDGPGPCGHARHAGADPAPR